MRIFVPFMKTVRRRRYGAGLFSVILKTLWSQPMMPGQIHCENVKLLRKGPPSNPVRNVRREIEGPVPVLCRRCAGIATISQFYWTDVFCTWVPPAGAEGAACVPPVPPPGWRGCSLRSEMDAFSLLAAS